MVFRTTAYAEQLLDDLKLLEGGWPTASSPCSALDRQERRRTLKFAVADVRARTASKFHHTHRHHLRRDRANSCSPASAAADTAGWLTGRDQAEKELRE